MRGWSMFLGISTLLATGCGDQTQQFGASSSGGMAGAAGMGGSAGATSTGGASGAAGAGGGIAVPIASEFEWLNPKPHGNGIRAVAATSDANLWIGGRGELLSWNGSKWTEHVPEKLDIAYHALWVRSPTDVWAGGTELSWDNGSPLEAPALYHYQGGAWKPYSLSGQSALSVLGGSADDGYLVRANGEVFHLQDQKWAPDGSFPAKVRAVWAAGGGEAWAVGENGFVAQRTSSGWSEVKPSMAGLGDPFGTDRHYVGIWGSSDSDVWAAFETANLGPEVPFYKLADGQVGFAHWDGLTWSVTQTGPMSCSSGDYPGQVYTSTFPLQSSNPVYHAFKDRDAFEARRGSLMSGRSANEIVASVGGGRCLWHYDGTSWQPIHQQYVEDAKYPQLFDVRYPLGNAPPVGATAGFVLLGGEAGQLMSFDPKEKLPGAPYTTLSPQLQQLFVAERPDLNELQLAGSERYALADGRPARWTANGWVPVSGPLGSLDPTTLFAPDDIEGQRGLHKLQVDRDGALWAFGGYHAAYAARFAGADWTAIAVEPRPGGFDGSPAHVWAAPSGEIWLNTTFDIRRYSGSGFQIYDLPVASGTTGSGFYGLSGFADGRVLVARTVTGPSSQYESVIYQIDGSQTTESLTLNDTADFYIATFAPDRALIIRSDGTPFAFDGSNWTTPDWTKPPIPGLWAPATRLGRVVARDVDDLFVLADDPRGSHVFHFDGKTWEVLFSADRLSSIAMDGNALWVVGPKGATARTTLHDPAK